MMQRSFFVLAATLGMLSDRAFAEACHDADVPQPRDCERSNSDIILTIPVGANTEQRVNRLSSAFDETGFSISIDGAPVAGAPPPDVPARQADIRANAAGLDIRIDGLGAQRLLNVTTGDLRTAYRAGERVRFRTSSNYPAWIERAEIRIIDRDAPGQRTISRLRAEPNGTVDWEMPAGGSGNYAYQLRVYDRRGAIDETVPRPIFLTTQDTTDEAANAPFAGEGQNALARQGIAIRGGEVTVSGRALAGRRPTVMGERVPIDGAGRFVTSRILPPGRQPIEVTGASRSPILRFADIPERELFYVGIVDITAGLRFDDDLAGSDPDYERSYLEGRLAFFLNGLTASGTKVTASVDTGDGPLRDVSRRLDDKDPRSVIQRLDPEDAYPVYGDDSTAFDEAPTSGRVFVRVERNGTRLTWGDFRAGLQGTRFQDQTRALYGAELRHQSPTVTSAGAPRFEATVFAAEPDTLPQRDILRGTGGSVYFLARQDINGGSETVRIEVVDPDTGRVISSRILAADVDYEIDYIQGVIILNEPLASTMSDGSVIGDGSSVGNDQVLAVSYEFTPTTGNFGGASLGGRVVVRPNDGLTFGVTASRDRTGLADQTSVGADARIAFGENSWAELEVARTDGPGFGRAASTDGGLTLSTSSAAGGRGDAFRFEVQADLADLGLSLDGSVGAYFERQTDGFSTPAEDVTADREVTGVFGEIAISENATFRFAGEAFHETGGKENTEGELSIDYLVSDRLTATTALAFTDRFTPSDPADSGERTDVAVRLEWQQTEDLSIYGFAQNTVSRSGGLARNNRLGFGGRANLSDKVSVTGELSGGDGGAGARARVNYHASAGSEVYFGYTLDPTRTGTGAQLLGRDARTFVYGARQQRSDRIAVWGEQTLDLFGNRSSRTQAYGITYTPTTPWTFSGGLEVGEVRDATDGDFDRYALSVGASYAGEGQSGHLRLEYRTEDGDGLSRDRDTWVFAGGYERRIDDNWRLLFDIDTLVSDSAEGAFRDGEYVEATLGYAYRPIENERLNLLFRYTYLLDQPTEDQVNVAGEINGPKQRSHILSVDGNYDLNPKLTFGAKYGLRFSETAARGTSAFSSSNAQLGILRLDWHVVSKWDLSAEIRVLDDSGSSSQSTGAVLGAYRHVGDNVKIGVGYEWGRVSDNLADINYSGQGVFLNIVAKF